MTDGGPGKGESMQPDTIGGARAAGEGHVTLYRDGAIYAQANAVPEYQFTVSDPGTYYVDGGGTVSGTLNIALPSGANHTLNC